MGIDYLAQNKNSNKTAIKTYNLVIQFFVEIFVGMALGYFLGKYLDVLLFEDRQILIYVLMLLGIVAAFVNLVKRAMATIDGGKEDEKD